MRRYVPVERYEAQVDDNEALCEALEDALTQAETAQGEIAALESKVQALKDHLLAMRDATDPASNQVPPDLNQAATRKLVGDEELTPHEALCLVASLWPERIMVLPSAMNSATAASGFRQGRRLLELLRRLATDYYDILAEGPGGDREARRVFGAGAFALRESKTTEANERARRERTFHHNGRSWTMWRHLKIGNSNNSEESIRVHFDWDPEAGRVVFGHCGRHLYLPGYR